MEQDERAAVDLHPEGNTEHGGEATALATAVVLAGEVAKEGGVSEVGGSIRDTASESAKKQDLEEKGTSLRPSSRDREQAVPMSFTVAGDAEPAGSEAADLGASSSAAPATGSHEDVPAMENDDQGAALRRACSAPGTKTKVAIAHASPRDSYRRVPWRSRKQHSPKRFVAMAGAPSARDPPHQTAGPGSALPSASTPGTRSASEDTASSSSSSSLSTSRRPPSRRRKQLRTEHFVREEAEATASAKARRSDIVLDRFLSCLVRRCPASRSEWVRNVTADDS